MISVIIPVFNAEDTIVDCINSVISQTRCDLIDEILVIDDGSTDRTVQEIEHSINSDLVRVVSKANGGVSSARNEGIRLSQGSWIALLDSDDIWLSNKIEKQYEKIMYYPEIKFIGTNRNNENVKLGKAGRSRHMGKRPEVRGSVMNPVDHPHGGGEGRAPVGHAGPMTPWGKPALGYKTRKKNKQSNKFIVKRRK